MTGFCGPPSRATGREGWELTSWEDAVRRVASERWQRLRTAQAARPRCSTSWSCSAQQSPFGRQRPSLRLWKPPGRRDTATSRPCMTRGLLTAVRNGYYSLGPRIIEMDLQLRQTDPLLLASQGVLEDLVETIGHSALLCTAYDDSVLCIGEYPRPTQPGEPVQPRPAAPVVPRSSVEGHPGPSPPSPPESHLPSSMQGA